MKIRLSIDTLLFFVALTILVILGFTIDETYTGDSGDSITHFLYSKFAFTYPEFFFNHWAKPFFCFDNRPIFPIGF